ncbi:primase C-terminal domain-containing protein [Sulfobacillus harzensis]|uniref:Primase C-terminal 1 domain-containing protein n=1 Tax=Sulfobacillus harzensis TaxID=2729629 RepID=A0A7Y0L409_9FIRM|nr:primase C-terminal domain-containing protein [Sulfobacillus harzensis]NMP22898.1 hypothetical protein [Sulfobacillus harzensis]
MDDREQLMWEALYGDIDDAYLLLAWPARKNAPTPNGDRHFIPLKTWLSAHDADRVVSLLSSFEGDRELTLEDAHHGVLPRRTKNVRDTLPIILYADLDDVTDITWELIDDLGIDPTAIVASGRGLHAYWRLEREITVDDFRQAVRALYRALIANPQAARQAAHEAGDPTRLFRIPGGRNYRYRPPRPIRIMRVGGDRYSWQEVRSALAPWWDEPETPPSENARITPEELTDMLSGVGRGTRNTVAIRIAGHLRAYGLSVDEIRQWLDLWNSRNHPPLSHSEMRKVVASIGRYAVTPTISSAAVSPSELALLYRRFPGLRSAHRGPRAGAVKAALLAGIAESAIMTALIHADPRKTLGPPDRLVRWAQHHLQDERT